MKFIIVCGSLRKESKTIVLTNIAYEYAEEKYTGVEYLDLRKTRINNFEVRTRDDLEGTELTNAKIRERVKRLVDETVKMKQPNL